MKIMKSVYKVGNAIAKHSPVLLTVGGVLGLGATAVLSYKAAAKVEVITEKIEKSNFGESEKQRITEEMTNPNQRLLDEEYAELQDDLAIVTEEYQLYTKKEVVRDIAGAVALPVLTGIASLACITLSYYIQNNRIVNLASALATATAERHYYKNKYAEQHGEEAAKVFYTPTQDGEVETTDVKGKAKKVKGKMKADIPSLHGEWFDKSSEYVSDDHDYNMAFINSVTSKMDLKMFQKGSLTMNEVFDELGLQRTRGGAIMGWSVGTGFNLYTEVTNVLNKYTGEEELQIYVKWPTPVAIYDVIEFQ